jgi:hypothetical protein
MLGRRQQERVVEPRSHKPRCGNVCCCRKLTIKCQYARERKEAPTEQRPRKRVSKTQGHGRVIGMMISAYGHYISVGRENGHIAPNH